MVQAPAPDGLVPQSVGASGLFYGVKAYCSYLFPVVYAPSLCLALLATSSRYNESNA